MKFKAVLMDEDALSRALMRIAHQILENNQETEDLCLIGIKTRGVPLAKRVCKNIETIAQKKPLYGVLDITLYRDDLSKRSDDPVLNGSDIPFDITAKNVILVDDVIYTGRTVRAAMDALFAIGRPDRIQLVALIDRGHRELPIRADYVGKNVPTSKQEVVAVCLEETDGSTGVSLFQI